MRPLTSKEKMDRFGVVPENKTVFPRTEAEYAAAAENAERQQQQQQEKAAAMGSALKEDDAVDETVAESEGPPRIFLM